MATSTIKEPLVLSKTVKGTTSSIGTIDPSLNANNYKILSVVSNGTDYIIPKIRKSGNGYYLGLSDWGSPEVLLMNYDFDLTILYTRA